MLMAVKNIGSLESVRNGQSIVSDTSLGTKKNSINHRGGNVKPSSLIGRKHARVESGCEKPRIISELVL